jgi:hypothetical protein
VSTNGSVEPTTTLATRSPQLIPADPGFSFSSTPIVAGDALFVTETALSGGVPLATRVARIALNTGRITATYDPRYAATLALAGDSLWVAIDPYLFQDPPAGPGVTRLVRLDPQTLAPRGVVTLRGPAHTEDLRVARGALWTLSGEDAIRIDPATGHVAATVPLDVPVSNPVRTLAVSDDGTRLYVGWATPEQTDGVTEFDATSGHVLHQNSHAGGGPSSTGPQLTYAGARLWVTFPTGNLGASVALNASDLAATGEVIRGPNALAIAPDTNVVWVSRVTQLDCVTPNDLTLASHALPGSVTSAVATTPAAVYVATGNGIATIKRDRACPR